MSKLVIFDLDGTLLNGDSDHGWIEYLIKKGRLDADSIAQNNAFFEDYKKGKLHVGRWLDFAVRPLRKIPGGDLEILRRDFLREVIAPMITPAALALIEKHRKQGHRLIIATSTNRFVAEPIAEKLGIKELVATELKQDEKGNYTGHLPPPCFGEGKVVHLQRYLSRRGLELMTATVYSDSIADLPLLNFCARPFAVRPCAALEKVAREKNWPIIRLD